MQCGATCLSSAVVSGTYERSTGGIRFGRTTIFFLFTVVRIPDAFGLFNRRNARCGVLSYLFFISTLLLIFTNILCFFVWSTSRLKVAFVGSRRADLVVELFYDVGFMLVYEMWLFFWAFMWYPGRCVESFIAWRPDFLRSLSVC